MAILTPARRPRPEIGMVPLDLLLLKDAPTPVPTQRGGWSPSQGYIAGQDWPSTPSKEDN
jgi:hypothetical protein